MVQRVAVPVAQGRCAEAHQVSPSDQDASDPVLAAASDGNAVLFWLAARDLDPGQYNDTVTDVWAVGLDAAGLSHAPPLRVTSTQGHRFGLSAAVAGDGATVWLAYRVVPDSGTEARGDGGQVAVMRLARTPQGVARPGDAAVVTATDATPTGSVRVFARERGAEVWWRERTPGGVVTMHRSLDANGRAQGGAEAVMPEPWLHGALPAFADGSSLTTVQRSPGGGVGLVRYRCAPNG